MGLTKTKKKSFCFLVMLLTIYSIDFGDNWNVLLGETWKWMLTLASKLRSWLNNYLINIK